MEECPLTEDKAQNDAKEEDDDDDVVIDEAEVAIEAAEKAKSISNAMEENLNEITTKGEHAIPEKDNSIQGDSVAGSSQRGPSSLHALMKAFGNRPKYNGSWDEDLIGTIEVYELAVEMCTVSDDEMLKGIPTMLDGAALSYYGSHVKGKVSDYKSASGLLLSWFTSDEQRSRLLNEWHEIRLRTLFKRHPDKS